MSTPLLVDTSLCRRPYLFVQDLRTAVTVSIGGDPEGNLNICHSLCLTGWLSWLANNFPASFQSYSSHLCTTRQLRPWQRCSTSWARTRSSKIRVTVSLDPLRRYKTIVPARDWKLTKLERRYWPSSTAPGIAMAAWWSALRQVPQDFPPNVPRGTNRYRGEAICKFNSLSSYLLTSIQVCTIPGCDRAFPQKGNIMVCRILNYHLDCI